MNNVWSVYPCRHGADCSVRVPASCVEHCCSPAWSGYQRTQQRWLLPSDTYETFLKLTGAASGRGVVHVRPWAHRNMFLLGAVRPYAVTMHHVPRTVPGTHTYVRVNGIGDMRPRTGESMYIVCVCVCVRFFLRWHVRTVQARTCRPSRRSVSDRCVACQGTDRNGLSG